MPNELWKITCEEHRYPGLWQRWFRSQSVALGWAPVDGYHIDGSGVKSLGWTIARNAMARIKPAGRPHLCNSSEAGSPKLGTVTDLAVQDDEWNPLIPPTRTNRSGDQGRRIRVRWDLELGPDDREQVVELPPDTRLSGAQLRTTLSVVRSISLNRLKEVLGDPTNWVRLWANFDYERALSGYIAAFPHRLEDGLLPYPLEKTRERRGHGRTRMDVLLIDESGRPVVLWNGNRGRRCWIIFGNCGHTWQKVHEDTGKVPRGIFVHGGARQLRDEIRREASRRPVIDLVQHNLEVGFSRST